MKPKTKKSKLPQSNEPALNSTPLSELEERNDELHGKYRDHMLAAQEVEKEIKKLEPVLEAKRYKFFARLAVDDAVQEIGIATNDLNTALRTCPAFAKAMSPAMAALEEALSKFQSHVDKLDERG